MSIKLQGSLPIADCSVTIRNLASEARGFHKAMNDLQRQIRRSSPGSSATLGDEWDTYLEEYRGILQTSDTLANNIAATINVYLALQGDVGEEDADDMIEELSALRRDLVQERTDPGVLCANLKIRIETFFRSIAPSTAPADGMRSSSVTHAPSPVSSGPVSVRDEVGKVSGRLADAADRRTLGRIGTALMTLQMPEDGKSGTCALAVHRDGNVINQGDLSRTLGTAESRVPPQTYAVDDTFISAVLATVQGLEKQSQQFKAFSEASKYLENELSAYQSAFQAVKAYPTPEKRTALQNMHSRVASSSKHWKELTSVLTDGYSRLQK
ncbi:hypothetical protein C8Q79DRAFT_1014269 [Trametes meyenii]|nr:hypothetical protein C8Q79DRAFT_1014269 [Trametes meyenii]